MIFCFHFLIWKLFPPAFFNLIFCLLFYSRNGVWSRADWSHQQVKLIVAEAVQIVVWLWKKTHQNTPSVIHRPFSVEAPADRSPLFLGLSRLETRGLSGDENIKQTLALGLDKLGGLLLLLLFSSGHFSHCCVCYAPFRFVSLCRCGSWVEFLTVG